MMLEAASETDKLAAVVSEGAGARAFSEEMDHDVPALEHWLGVPLFGARTAAVSVFANQTPPHNSTAETKTPATRRAAVVGRRRAHFHARSAGPTGRAAMGSSSRHLRRSAARSAAGQPSLLSTCLRWPRSEGWTTTSASPSR